MKTIANNNSNKFAIIYPGEVYVRKGLGLAAPSAMPKGKRCGYATDGEYMTAVNELHGWTLDHTIFFDWAHNAYTTSRATLGELVTMTGAQFGLRADDTSDWANDLRTVIGYYIEHFDSYLDAGLDVVCDPAALNRALSGVIFDGIQLYVDIYDVAEDIRAFAPYGPLPRQYKAEHPAGRCGVPASADRRSVHGGKANRQPIIINYPGRGDRTTNGQINL